jgi:hypothetical protein
MSNVRRHKKRRPTAAMKPKPAPRTSFLNSFIPLPQQHLREVLGVWAMVLPGAKLNRSIDVVEGKFYLVSRLVSEDGNRVGGEQGMLLRKVSEGEYHGTGPNQSVYRIAPGGELLSYIKGESEPSMQGVPCQSLWPE